MTKLNSTMLIKRHGLPPRSWTNEVLMLLCSFQLVLAILSYGQHDVVLEYRGKIRCNYLYLMIHCSKDGILNKFLNKKYIVLIKPYILKL